MTMRQRFASAFLTGFLVFPVIFFVHPGVIFAQEGREASAQEIDYDSLLSENRKLAMALAQATQRCLGENGNSGDSCAGMAELKAQNESLRETIKAQNQVMSADGSNVDGAEVARLRSENESLQGLKETIRELQAQNKHLSTAGNMGKTVTNQVLTLQDKIDQLKGVAAKEKQNAAVYKDKVKACEATIVDMEKGQAQHASTESFDAERLSLSKEITALKLETQELKARIELLKQKSGIK